MGIEYYLLNHEKCSMYELGKSFYFDIDEDFEYLTDEEFFIDLMNNDYRHEYDVEYLKLICKDLISFIDKTDKTKIQIINDASDDFWLARSVGYKCVGSRYYLGDSIENKKSIDSINSMSVYEVSEDDIEYLKKQSWNLEKYHRK